MATVEFVVFLAIICVFAAVLYAWWQRRKKEEKDPEDEGKI